MKPTPHRTLAVGLGLCLSVVLAACSDDPPTAGGGTATADDAAQAPSGQEIETSRGELGTFLVDGDGMALYMFTQDSPGKSACEGDCLEAWPPVTGEVTAGEGVDESKIGTIKRSDGTTQATYADWPLYYWAQDKKAGDTTGQTVGDVWYVLTPEGKVIKKAPAKG